MTRKPAFWAVLVAAALAAAVFSWRNFARGFPLVALDIRMDRQAALARAGQFASERRLGPADYRDAASFDLDESVQSFVELEGGGKPAFTALVGDRLFTPYRWRVRHFKEREKREAMFSFAPDGTPNGFVERLKEDEAGPALAEPAARAIAETAAARIWQVDLAPFRPVEHSQEQRLGGRVDHAFVYELADRRLGEGRLRLRLGVSGDKLTEVAYFLKIPEAFSRRYEQMRSANTAIGIGGSLAFILLYGVGGIAVGLFFLGRAGFVIWRQPVVLGAIVAFAQTLATVNEWPLAWMQYDTALSVRSFAAQQVVMAVVLLLVNTVMFALSFMAAESLTRRAFPDHPQFWRLWSAKVAPTYQVLGRTAAGFLFVSLFIAYEVLLYAFATKSLGWWTPSEALFNPDVLAAYVPGFSAIAKSAQAGLWEETLFRALPIAGAALIADRFGHRRRWWFVLAFAVQAVIFGSGHAPYPTQPAYARPVELVIPSIGFGLFYLFFGLLPGVVLHFAFDTFWFAMPLFASSAAGIRVQQTLLVTAALLPLWVVVFRRVQTGQWIDLPSSERNGAWRPAEPIVPAPIPLPEAVPHAGAVTPARVRALVVVGGLAAVVCAVAVVLSPLRRYPLTASRTQAIHAARAALASKHLGPSWRFDAIPDEGGGLSHRFIWQTAGAYTYGSLLGTYLRVPGWTVVVRTFQGDVAERAENWAVRLDGAGVVQDVSHELPESRAGPSLDETAAKDLARRSLVARFTLPAASLKDVSAVPSRLPARTDWTITFSDTGWRLPSGEARLSAQISGTEVTDLGRFVYVPDEWRRAARNAQTVSSILLATGSILFGLVLFGGVVVAIVSWSRRHFVVPVFLAAFAAFLVLSAARFANGFPAVIANLTTSQPFQLQVAVVVGSAAVGLGLLSAAVALVSGASPLWPRREAALSPRQALEAGLALGMLAAALRTVGSFVTAAEPAWPSYAGAGSWLPLLSAVASPVNTMVLRVVALLVIVAAADWITASWTRRRWLAIAVLIVLGGLLGAPGSPDKLLTWIGGAAAAGALLAGAYALVLRADTTVVPIAVAVMTSIGVLREGWARAYAGASAGSIAAVMLMAAVAWWWSLALRQPRLEQWHS